MQATDPVGEFFERAGNGEVDPCTWPIAALLVGGYALDGPPAPAIRNGPTPNVVRLPERE